MEENKKKLVIGVIGADVHAVGIQILDHAFEEAGFDVTNLGVMVSQEEYIAAAVETGLNHILLYVGGNIVVGKQPFDEVEARFKKMGFDRVFGPGTAPEETIKALKEDLGLQ